MGTFLDVSGEIGYVGEEISPSRCFLVKMKLEIYVEDSAFVWVSWTGKIVSGQKLEPTQQMYRFVQACATVRAERFKCSHHHNKQIVTTFLFGVLLLPTGLIPSVQI